MALLTDRIGTPIVLHVSSAIGTSDSQAASDNTAGVSIGGAESILFLIQHPNIIGEGGAGANVQIQYSSTGSASDAVTSNATMSCTDAVITFTTATNPVAATIYTLEFNVSRKGLDTRAGALFAKVQNDSNSALEVIAIPILSHGRFPEYAVTVVADD